MSILKVNPGLNAGLAVISSLSLIFPGLTLCLGEGSDSRRTPQEAQKKLGMACMNLVMRIAAAVIPLATYERSADYGGSDSWLTWVNVLALVTATADLVIYQRRLHAMRELHGAQTALRQFGAAPMPPTVASQEIDGRRYEVRLTHSGEFWVHAVDLAPAPPVAPPVAEPAAMAHRIEAAIRDRCTIL